MKTKYYLYVSFPMWKPSSITCVAVTRKEFYYALHDIRKDMPCSSLEWRTSCADGLENSEYLYIDNSIFGSRSTYKA